MSTTKPDSAPVYQAQSITSPETQQQVVSRLSIFLLIVVVLIAGVTHYENMLGFPHYLDSEGENIANAWWFINEGSLTPYTYAYEEAPTGTFVLAGWGALLGDFDQFGFPINAGRVLMLIFHLLCVALIFSTTRKLSSSDTASVIAALIFALSPLALSIQRRVIVDNIMLFFLLVSFYMLVGDRQTLYNYMFSAVFFAMAVLTKSTAILFLPAFVFTASMTAHPHLRRFAINLWMTFTLLLISLFPLYAQMREELFPQGFAGGVFGGDFPHVSLLERMLDRGPDTGVFLNIGSGFANSFGEWTDLTHETADPVIIYGGAIAVLFIAVMSGDNKTLRPLAAVAITFSLGMFLAGQVFITDIISLLPFFAMSIGIVIALAANLVSGIGGAMMKPVIMVAAVVAMLYPFWIFYSSRIDLYTLNQVQGQEAAVDWVVDNVPRDALVIVDGYAFVALRNAEFENTHHYWKVDTDPDVKFTLLGDNHCNIDYIISTPQVQGDVDLFGLDLVRRAMDNSQVLLSEENNGWQVEVRQVMQTNCPSLPSGSQQISPVSPGSTNLPPSGDEAEDATSQEESSDEGATGIQVDN